MVTRKAYTKRSKSNISVNYTMAFSSAIEKNGIVSPAWRWIKWRSPCHSLDKPDSEGQRHTGFLFGVYADQPVLSTACQLKAVREAPSPPISLVAVVGELPHFCHTDQCKRNPLPTCTSHDLSTFHRSVQSWCLFHQNVLFVFMSECLIISNKCFYIGSFVFVEIVSLPGEILITLPGVHNRNIF